MLKKQVGIFFILLANIVLLVHAVTPHHHHKEQVCIVNEHCQNAINALIDNTTEHDHEHDGNSGTECCVLKQALIIPANSLRHDFKYLGCNDDHFPFVHFQAVLFKNEFNSFVLKIISIAQIPLKNSSHFWFVSTSSGLRAPPIV